MEELGIYVHIPFCKRKCSYCDYKSFSNIDEINQKKYVDAKLKTECPKPYKMKNGKCTYTEVSNQKASFCPTGYNYVKIDNKDKCVKYKN